MAEENKNNKPAAEGPSFSEADKGKARAWFKKAADCRERREYDYAIECFITGLGFWPEAVEEGHMPLRSLAIQRQQTGGKKPSMMEGLKKPMVGKNTKQSALNAEFLLAKDPSNSGYLDGFLKSANKAGWYQSLKFIAPYVFESLKKDKKPDKGRFKTFRTTLIEAAERAGDQGDGATAVFLLDQAVGSLEFLIARMPADEDLRIEQRDLAGRLAIEKGKYADADTFRDSLQDGDKQKILHDSDRMKQADDSYEALVAAARKEYEENRGSAQKLLALVDVLLRREAKAQEADAIEVLEEASQRTGNYSFKQRADDVRLRQLARQVRQLAERAKLSGTEEDQQQLRLAKTEQLQMELQVFRERVSNYPTDLRLKFQLSRALFKAGEFDEAIPLLQTAQADPRSRHQCQLLIGRAFFEKGAPGQAVEVLKELLDAPELPEESSKEAMYWLARAHEGAGQIDEAKAAYGRLLRQDYNYANGEARRRMEKLK